ncbi:cubilin-like [Rhopilema esculentum]|uniref:cubilin-like n=1 Tax=Rhopilema esculentum TaxID=499914 RepID=UPI0031D61755
MPLQLLFISTLMIMNTANADKTNKSIVFISKLAQLETQYITSPRWPLEYPTNCDVRYKIVQNPNREFQNGFYLQIKWLEFDVKGDMQNCSDFAQIRYGKNEDQKFTFCSTQSPHTIYAVDHDIHLHFHSDKEDVGYGFRLAYHLTSFKETIGPKHCRRNIQLTSQNGVLSSIGWPRPVSGSCVFEFTLEADEVLLLNIMDFSVPKSNADCSRYNNYIEIRGNMSNKSFQESCPLTSLSSCENIRRWKLSFEKRRLYIYVNTVEIKGDYRGFLAGYTVYKKAKKQRNTIKQKETKWVFNAVTIGVITGVFIGILIVLLTVASVSICLKRGVI